LSINISLNGNIQANDSITSTTALRKVFTGLSTTGTAFSEAQSAVVGTSPTALGLPATPVLFAYIKNLHATQTISVTWTPNGGSSAVILVLQPGSFITFGEANTLSGVTAITLTGSGANTNYEFILAG
jgi:hypothetical protein